MEAYSLDLRERICAACDEGSETREEVAERFGVSRSFLQKLLRHRRVAGSIAPKPKGRGPRPLIADEDLRRLRAMVQKKPDATLAELCAGLADQGGVLVSQPTMCRALKALRLPLKKEAARVGAGDTTRAGASGTLEEADQSGGCGEAGFCGRKRHQHRDDPHPCPGSAR